MICAPATADLATCCNLCPTNMNPTYGTHVDLGSAAVDLATYFLHAIRYYANVFSHFSGPKSPEKADPKR
jgi:hypothetical protein